MSEDFGSYLKHQRELRGVPLDEIAQSTKISLRFLRALEENRFDDLPGEVFIKGFIRSYGQAIGSNVEELLAVYHETHKPAQASPAESSSVSVQEAPPEPASNFPVQAVVGFAAALLIIGGGIYWVNNSKKPENTMVSKDIPAPVDTTLSPVAEIPETAPEETENPVSVPEESPVTPAPPEPAEPQAGTEIPSPEPATKNTVTVPEKDAIIKDLQDQSVPPPMASSTEVALEDSSLNLVIRVSENAWFNLTVDEFRDQDFILPPGGSKTIRANNGIVMTIGNRRATQLFLNGQPLELPDSPDNVIRNLTVNAEQLN